MRLTACIGALALSLLGGCAPRQTAGNAVSFNLWNENWKSQRSFQLMPEGEKFLDEVLASEPEVSLEVPVGLEPTGLLTHEGRRYAIEPDQVVLLAEEGAKIWKRKGIRKALIAFSLPFRE